MNDRYCIIAGAPRSGSTSLFEYLAAHPCVAASHVKQTGYFLDPDYAGVASPPRTDLRNGGIDYESMFSAAGESDLRLESTPDYLYSAGTPGRIADRLGDRANIIFILRDPVEQFVSYYHHYKRIGWIPTERTLEAHVALVLSGENENFPDIVRNGVYVPHLRRYLEHFDSDRISVRFLADLEREPLAFMKDLAETLSLDPSFYDGYQFVRFNGASDVRSRRLLSVYREARGVVLGGMRRSELARRWLQPVRRRVAFLYAKTNSLAVTSQALSREARLRLRDVYANDARELETMIDRPVPWSQLELTPTARSPLPAENAR